MNDPHGPLKILAYRISLRKALKDKERVASTIKAVNDEIENMENNSVGKFVQFTDIPAHLRPDIVPAHMFLKDKYKADGSFDKVKARMVAGGNARDPDSIGETFAPTVNPMSVFTQLQITVARKYELSAYDIKGAFLLSPVHADREIYLLIPADIVEHWVRLYPRREKHVHVNGCMYYKLNKFVYGLQESPREFNILLDDALQSIGFASTKADRCLYTKATPDGIMIVSIHVDDLLVTSPSVKERDLFEKALKKNFVIVSQYNNLSYLGMNIDYNLSKDRLKVSQPGFVRDLVSREGFESLKKFPRTRRC